LTPEPNFVIIIFMTEAEPMIDPREKKHHSTPESKELSLDNLESYINGCEEIAVRLHTSIQKIREQGKRPVILIPSRGAVPIFLLARRFMNELEEEHSCLSDKNARFYPEGIFDYLEGNKTKTNERGPGKVDVILFPFTADVSLEGIKGDERLAELLRKSCARSILEIVEGTRYKSKDLNWYKFIMKKFNGSQETQLLKPDSIVTSIESYPQPKNPQIILIDTVISGRAANDVTEAFVGLAHPVVPILAVDSTKEGKFQSRRRAQIIRTIPWELIDEERGLPFVDFPLLTEDKGSALLGVVAVNFINFNEESFFHKVDKKYHQGYTPQSCVFTLPAISIREKYLSNFRRFIEIAWQSRSPNTQGEIYVQELNKLRRDSHNLTYKHPAPSIEEISEIISIPQGTQIKETSSHIVSIHLPTTKAEQWIGEFSQE